MKQRSNWFVFLLVFLAAASYGLAADQTLLHIAPSRSMATIPLGEAYSVQVQNPSGNLKNTWVDVQYYYNGAGPFTATSVWPLDQYGHFTQEVNTSTPLGVYKFDRIRRTGTSTWTKIPSVEIEISDRQVTTPELYIAPKIVQLGEAYSIQVFGLESCWLDLSLHKIARKYSSGSYYYSNLWHLDSFGGAVQPVSAGTEQYTVKFDQFREHGQSYSSITYGEITPASVVGSTETLLAGWNLNAGGILWQAERRTDNRHLIDNYDIGRENQFAVFMERVGDPPYTVWDYYNPTQGGCIHSAPYADVGSPVESTWHDVDTDLMEFSVGVSVRALDFLDADDDGVDWDPPYYMTVNYHLIGNGIHMVSDGYHTVEPTTRFSLAALSMHLRQTVFTTEDFTRQDCFYHPGSDHYTEVVDPVLSAVDGSMHAKTFAEFHCERDLGSLSCSTPNSGHGQEPNCYSIHTAETQGYGISRNYEPLDEAYPADKVIGGRMVVVFYKAGESPNFASAKSRLASLPYPPQ